MNRLFIAERSEPLVEAKIGDSEPSPTLRVLDAIPLRVEEQNVVFVLKCRLTERVEVCLCALVIKHRFGGLNESMESELLADTGQGLGIG
jgi:hypothetical protein